MKRKVFLMVALSLTAMICAFPLCGKDKSLTVFAAASTTDAMQDIGRAFEKEAGIKVKLNLGSSGTLARQLEQGAPGDVYISASKKWADYALRKKLIKVDSKCDFLTNGLVVVVPRGSEMKSFMIDEKLDFPALFKGRLSIGDPAHVPAGKYAKAALEYYGWYDKLKKRLLPAMDVRSALLTVEMGEVDMGIVYATDAMKSKKVKIVSTFSPISYPEIVYVCGICPGADASAKSFVDFMLGPKGAEIFEKYGFKPLKYGGVCKSQP